MTEGPDLGTLGGRVKHLRLALAAPLGGAVARDRLAVLVAERMGESKPVHGSTVKGWEEGVEPSLRVIQALADLAAASGLPHLDAGWIAFGQQLATPKPLPAGPEPGHTYRFLDPEAHPETRGIKYLTPNAQQKAVADDAPPARKAANGGKRRPQK